MATSSSTYPQLSDWSITQNNAFQHLFDEDNQNDIESNNNNIRNTNSTNPEKQTYRLLLALSRWFSSIPACVRGLIFGLLVGGLILYVTIVIWLISIHKTTTSTATTSSTVSTTMTTGTTTTTTTTTSATTATTSTTSTSTTTTTTSTTTSTSTTTTTTSTTTSTSTTSTTSTTTTSTTSTTTTSTSATTTTSTTTTAAPSCASTCVNTTTSTSSRVAFYSFDSNTADATGNYPASGISSPTYVIGWVGSAISFTAANTQQLSTASMPLNSRTFTIDFWFYATDISSNNDYGMVGEYMSQTGDGVLFISLYYQAPYFGFFADDTGGAPAISTSKWYHLACVYDSTAAQRYIYLNGVLVAQSSANPLLVTPSAFTIGGASIGGRNPTLNMYYSGYIDHLTISYRAKSACEIYLDALLACYFPFDSSAPLVDSGPNFLTATNTGATTVTGRVNQAFQFSSSLSYILVSGISALLSQNTVFTISMWVNPTSVTGGGTLLHCASQSNGVGTCLTMWGLTSGGAVTVNVVNSANTAVAATAPSALPLNMWVHIAQTFSSTNGSRLYINGYLVTTVSVPTGTPIGPYAFIGASPSGSSPCNAGSIAIGQFYGSVDEFRVFGRELTAADVCRLANP